MSEVILILCFVELVLLIVLFFVLYLKPKEEKLPGISKILKKQKVKKKLPRVHDDNYILAKERDKEMEDQH